MGKKRKLYRCFKSALELADKYYNTSLGRQISNEIVETIGLKLVDPIFTKCYEGAIILRNKVENQTDGPSKVKSQKEVVEHLEKHFELNPKNPRIRTYLAQSLGTLSWYFLFIKDFESAELSARRGLFLDSQENWIVTNIASSLLFQGRYKEAEKIYLQFKEKAFDEKKSWSEVFLADLEELESSGITHPDVEKIRIILR